MIQASLSRAGTPEKLANSYATSVSWFINRRPLSRRALSKVHLNFDADNVHSDLLPRSRSNVPFA